MESNWAVEHLQTIRTLMERSAVYRRALAPIMFFAGFTGVLAAAIGLALHLDSPRAFGGFWLGTAFVAVAGAFLIARRQALKDHEPFWSPSTRRVTQALLPPLTAGMCLGFVFVFVELANVVVLTFIWLLFYGCALHAAGFFISPGGEIFWWGYIGPACGGIFHAARREIIWVDLYRTGLRKSVLLGNGPAGGRVERALADGLFLRCAASGLRRVFVPDRKRKECGVNTEPFLQLNRVIHEKGRLAIMSMLAASPELSFTELRDALTMTDGNLTPHIRALQQEGYVAVAKSYQNNRPLTTCSLTPAGRKAFAEYINLLEQIVRQNKGK